MKLYIKGCALPFETFLYGTLFFSTLLFAFFPKQIALGQSRLSSSPISFHQIYSNASDRRRPANIEAPIILPAELPLPETKAAPAKKNPIPAPVEPQLSCPNPFVLDGNICKAVKFVEGTYICPKQTGYFENGKCVTIEEAPPSLLCPQGSLLDGKKCVVVDMTPPAVYCPKGFSADPEGNECVSREILKSDARCPVGYESKHGKCAKMTALPLTPVCPDGYVIQTYGHMKHADCVLAEVVQIDMYCPKDFELQGNICIKTLMHPPIGNCPHGYKAEGPETCTKIVVQDPEAVCPQGAIDSLKKDCVVHDTTPPIPLCKKDYEFEKDMCVKAFEVGVDYSCPHGYRMDGSRCVAHEQFNPDYVCPHNTIARDKFCYKSIDTPSIQKCPKGDLMPNRTCVYTEVMEPKNICRSGSSKREDACYETTVIPADLACPDGAQLEGKHCMAYILIPAETYCKDGSTPTPAGCAEVTVRDMQMSCPDGFKIKGEECFAHVEAPTELVCPSASVSNGKKSETYRVVNPIVSCPKDFIMDGTGQCFMSDFAEPIIACNPGMHLSRGSCVPSKHHKFVRRRRLSLE